MHPRSLARFAGHETLDIDFGPQAYGFSMQRHRKRGSSDYRSEIMALLASRARGTSICPSEVLAGCDKKNSALMAHVRRSAVLLATEGKIEIVQRGRRIDPQKFRGPIRLRLRGNLARR